MWIWVLSHYGGKEYAWKAKISCPLAATRARYYDEFTTPRDGSGHGTHVASTAAGRPVFDASYYNLTRGTARGGAPGSRIAVYRVCTNDKITKCHGSAILKAFDDAIADGVDVLSLSLGPSSIMPHFSNDPIAIGAFHAVEKGIIVVSLETMVLLRSILLCENNVGTEQAIDKFETLKNNYGINGMILIDSMPVGQVPLAYGVHPIVSITEDDRPDIAAPGVMILAAWPTIITDQTLIGREPPMFALLSGTSMACPHVLSFFARVKSQHPTWSPSIIRSAIMTTAIRTNNLESPITTITGSRATPYDIGAGSISTSGPIQPGLVYETEILDYILFLCNIGYDPSKIKLIAPNVPTNFSCPPNKSFDSISNMNYPSIAISNLTINEVKTVTRIVTNVEDDDSTYDVIIEAPTGVDVQVIPEKLYFTKDVNKLQFQVAFKVSAKFREDLFGSIAWSNEKHNVRAHLL
ncbi:hypothetical protein DH2020_035344 [Rehmannia glutinosa]|uniref:Uncharacterized protein n=1 Tax=Rehmannia glutinosa TaxID=99300 RepID=A0ABR0V8K8_REHGL